MLPTRCRIEVESEEKPLAYSDFEGGPCPRDDLVAESGGPLKRLGREIVLPTRCRIEVESEKKPLAHSDFETQTASSWKVGACVKGQSRNGGLSYREQQIRGTGPPHFQAPKGRVARSRRSTGSLMDPVSSVC